MQKDRLCALILLPATFISFDCARIRGRSTRELDLIQQVAWESSNARTVYVVDHGWHTGLVLRTSDISPSQWPEICDFANSEFVIPGWGDEGFYRARKITAPQVMSAAFLPTPSVVHVAGFTRSIREFYPASDIN